MSTIKKYYYNYKRETEECCILYINRNTARTNDICRNSKDVGMFSKFFYHFKVKYIDSDATDSRGFVIAEKKKKRAHYQG